MGTYGHAWASSCPNSLEFSKKHSESTKKHPCNFHPDLIKIYQVIALRAGQRQGKATQGKVEAFRHSKKFIFEQDRGKPREDPSARKALEGA